MRMNTLKDLYVAELKDIYDAEEQMLKVLPRMEKVCSNDELRSIFQEHTHITQIQKDRIEKIFGMLSMKPIKRKCDGMSGIIKEGIEIMTNGAQPSVLDAAMIGSAQRLKHYEMCVYGSLCAYAKLLGFGDQADLLQETLKEESNTDRRLTDLAMRTVNVEAA